MPSGLVLGTLSNEGNAEQLAAAIATGGAWATPALNLYLASLTPGPGTTSAQFTAAKAVETIAATGSVTWSAPGVDSSGTPTALSSRVFFQNEGTTAETIGGAWVQLPVTGPPASTPAAVFFPFDVPVTVAAGGGFIGVIIGLQTPAGAGYVLIDY